MGPPTNPRTGGFGSTRVAALTTIEQSQPQLPLKMGADVSVIAKKDWPESYPTQPVHNTWGVGGYEQAQKSFQPIVLEIS